MKQVTRSQTGVRLETRLLKVLKGLAAELEMPLGDLIEGIVLHAFEGMLKRRGEAVRIFSRRLLVLAADDDSGQPLV